MDKDNVVEIHSIPTTPKASPSPYRVLAPPSQLHSPSLSRSPLLENPTTPGRSLTPRFLTPLASPVVKAVTNMRGYLEDVGHLTKLNPQDAWLPITESRNGNAYYAAFHTLCAGIGFQALLLPVAFTFLGWVWGTICLLLVFSWQLYTLRLLTQLHESLDGTRHSRYLHLCIATFGEKLGKWLAMFPIMYLSAGTCTVLIIVGGGSLKLFFNIVCGATCKPEPLTTVEWYLVFVCFAVVLSQLPNLNSIAGVSLIGAITAVGYCSIIWILSLSKGKITDVSYGAPASEAKSEIGKILGVINGIGIIAFAFRGHNLTLEIQGTMPSSLKHPSQVPMWRGVKMAYTIIATCLFPIAVVGYWAYGNMIPPNGILTAMNKFHGADTSRALLATTNFLVVINCLSSFQIYAMPIFDDMESGYTSKHNKPCPRWLRAGFRVFFGFFNFFIAVAFPFLSSLASLIGGVSLPVTLAYPCFMWVVVRRPRRWSMVWLVNWGLGWVGMGLSFVLVGGAVWGLVVTGLKFEFFKPQS